MTNKDSRWKRCGKRRHFIIIIYFCHVLDVIVASNYFAPFFHLESLGFGFRHFRFDAPLQVQAARLLPLCHRTDERGGQTTLQNQTSQDEDCQTGGDL